MTSGIAELLVSLRRYGAESAGLEVKTGRTELPADAIESLCAFANTPGGGVLLLGVDERQGFRAVGVDNPQKIQHDVASRCRDDLEPPLRPDIAVVRDGDSTVVAITVVELPRADKPCYIKSRGINRGSYVRVGNSDRRLTAEEVQQVVADRGQPRYDHEVVHDATIDDLDPRIVQSYVARLRQTNPRIFGDLADVAVLSMTNVVIDDGDGVLRPSMAGLLAMGLYPQRYLPQLNITFVHYPNPTGAPAASGTRFIDNVRLDGPIPLMLRESMGAVMRNMVRRAQINSLGREDIWEYPPNALREIIANALVHRDLSPGSRGTQVQIEMYPDRLRVLNPGGLFGAVDIGRLGQDGLKSARNANLVRILEDVVLPDDGRAVCENRGSGIRAIRDALGRAGMRPPVFLDRVTWFEVSLPNHTLFDDATVAWLDSVSSDQFVDSQRTALALMRHGEVLDNGKYRAATGVDSRVATNELQELVAHGLVSRIGDRGRTQYVLADNAMPAVRRGTAHVTDRHRQIVAFIEQRGEVSRADLAEHLGTTRKNAEYWLAKLRREGIIEPTTLGRRPDVRYRLVSRLTD